MSLSFYYLAIASVFLYPVEKQEPKGDPTFDGLPRDKKILVHSVSLKCEESSFYKTKKRTKLKYNWDKQFEIGVMRDFLAGVLSTNEKLVLDSRKDANLASSLVICTMMALEKLVTDEFGADEAKLTFEQCAPPEDFAEWAATARTKKKMTALTEEFAKTHFQNLDKQPGTDDQPKDTNAITNLTVQQAKELAKKEGTLYLNGLTAISVEVATELAKSKGALVLNGLKTLPAHVATELAKSKGILALNGLTTLPVEVATELAKNEGTLYLDGLTAVSVEVATELAKNEGTLSLDGLTALPIEVAKELAKSKGKLEINSLKPLPPNVAKELAKHEGILLLGLTTLPIEVATELAKNEGILGLNGLTILPVEVATELAKNKGILGLGGLKTLPIEVATELAKHKGELLLNGLTALPIEVAKELAKSKGFRYLNGLITVSPKTLAILKTNPKIILPNDLQASEPKNTPEGKD